MKMNQFWIRILGLVEILGGQENTDSSYHESVLTKTGYFPTITFRCSMPHSVRL